MKECIWKKLEEIYNEEETNLLRENTSNEDEDDFDDIDNVPLTQNEINFGNEVRELLQSLIIDKALEEDFINDRGASEHFSKHCIGHNRSLRSTRSNVYYDFKDVSLYKGRERTLNDAGTTYNPKSRYSIPSLEDYALLQKVFHLFFEGNKYIYLTSSCGLKNRGDSVALILHSYANNVTRNYGQNTIDLLAIGRNGKTITMYPIDANYLENKFNNIVRRYSDKIDFDLKINH